MGLVRLWWTAVVRPRRAFEEVAVKPAPGWAFKVVLSFNVLITLTTTLARVLAGQAPLLPSWLTILPTEKYLFAELFFLPVLRMALWLLGAAVVHSGIRLFGKPSEFDRILTIGGIQYLVVVTYSFLVDWTTLALGAFDIGLIGYIHGGVDLVWSVTLQVIGLRVLLGLKTGFAIGLSLASTAFTLPFLALFAR
jgi:multisubunit Na+/H+ antiporter MnhF subunit